MLPFLMNAALRGSEGEKIINVLHSSVFPRIQDVAHTSTGIGVLALPLPAQNQWDTFQQ